MILISVQPGEEVIDSITRQLKKNDIQNGAVVSLIGAVDSCCISTMAGHDAMQDILTEYEQPFELTGTGEVKDGIPHLHCVLAKEGDVALSGHLHWARVENFFVNAYVIAM
ncbi:MAG: PCC domain-containing protein [Pseudonocardiaceae bacterium]